MPPTVEATEEFVVASSHENTWGFFSNLSNIGACIPGCEAVSLIDNDTASFKVKLKVGYLSKTFDIKTRMKEKVPPSRISFAGVSPDAEISGSLELGSELNGEVTLVKYRIEIRPVSVTGKTAITMMGKDLVAKQAAEFARCVKSKLETAK